MTVGLITQLASGAFILVVCGLAWYYRRRAQAAETADVADKEQAVQDSALAKDEGVRVQSLELERAKRIVETFAEAQKEAARVTDPQDASDRANAGLERLRR